jgi:hypothetical protein
LRGKVRAQQNEPPARRSPMNPKTWTALVICTWALLLASWQFELGTGQRAILSVAAFIVSTVVVVMHRRAVRARRAGDL